MADEAAVVGVGRGYWAAACSRCDWIYRGQCREVDSAARAHCRGCGGDVVAMTNPGKEVVLRLERDVDGQVVPGYAPEPEQIQSPDEEMREYSERIQRSRYWRGRVNKRGFEE